MKRIKATTEGTSHIMVRVPPWMHEALKELAHRHQTSLNQLCVRIFQGFTNKEGYEDAADSPSSSRKC